MQNETPGFIVTIGTSAGGFFALAELINQLNEDMDAAFFVVMHLSNQGIGGYLVNQMQKYTSLFCVEVDDPTNIRRGTIYFARPNKHLIIKNRKVKLGCGPEENCWRPSIDVLFRSAAASYNGHTIGVILTGMTRDGISGMAAIKKCGGTCIVQDPNEAEYPDMPLSVLKEIEVDYSLPLAKMGTMISEVINNKKIVKTTIPEYLLQEVKIAEEGIGSIKDLSVLGKSSVLTCPDCGGVLFELQNDPVTRYKCHMGHTFSVTDLLHKQSNKLESTLWVCLRALEERKKLLSQLVEKEINRRYNHAVSDDTGKIHELEKHIESLKTVLFETQDEGCQT
jgi:two-component system chemotaxis response regulator CheB